MDEIQYNQLLDLTYEAAVNLDLWPKVLERVACAAGAWSAALIQQNEVTGEGQGIRANTDPAATQLYYGYFATRNAFLQAQDPRATLRGWQPTVYTDEEKLPKSALMRTEFYNDFMRRFDVHSVLMVRVALRGMDTFVLNLTRPRRREQFDCSEIRFVRRLQPHLIRAFELGEKLEATRGAGRDLGEALDRSADGVLLLDGAGRVRHVNRSGERLLRAADGLTVTDGKLSAVAPAHASRLRGLIDAAATRDGAGRVGGSMSIGSASRRRPLHVSVAPNRAEALSMFGADPGVIVHITDLEAPLTVPLERLSVLFGLTRAEARLVRTLYEGATLKEAAEQFGVSAHTVHAQLSRIFEKTGVRRQSELAKLMARVAVVDPD